MSEQKKYNTIEESINDLLNGENQKNARDWVIFLRANEFALVWNPKDKQLRIDYKDRIVSCSYVDVGGADIIINFCTLDFDDGRPVSDDLKEFTLSHVVVCPQGCDAHAICEKSQKSIKIFGQEYENICISPLQIINPDAKDFEYAKKMILMVKQKRNDRLPQ
ncbi:MAG: hypothetical protein FWF44_03540 [Defluviitaleaceae bacterium]|nr:hypothetical protein [Defluviitaleaceae bacterium]